MRIIFSLILILLVNSLSAQSKETANSSALDTSMVFEKVDVQPSVDPQLWRKLLIDSLQHIVADAASNGMKKGTYLIKVRFVVELDGSVSNVKALNDFGYGLAKGAENIVKASPNWKPGQKNGKDVRSYRTQPFTFVIEEP